MGFFGSNSKKAQDYQDIEQPGAYAVDPPLPVATPVSDNHVAQQTPVPQQQQATRVVLVSTHDPTLTRNPMLMRQCPSCQQESRTRIRTSPTWQTWLASLVLLFLFWPICWIPLVLDAAKQTDHFCVLCGSQVGQVNAFQDCCVTHQS